MQPCAGCGQCRFDHGQSDGFTQCGGAADTGDAAGDITVSDDQVTFTDRRLRLGQLEPHQQLSWSARFEDLQTALAYKEGLV